MSVFNKAVDFLFQSPGMGSFLPLRKSVCGRGFVEDVAA